MVAGLAIFTDPHTLARPCRVILVTSRLKEGKGREDRETSATRRTRVKGLLPLQHQTGLIAVTSRVKPSYRLGECSFHLQHIPRVSLHHSKGKS